MAQNLPNKLRVMVDANILVSGVAWPRFPYEVLRHAVADDYKLVLSPRIIDEARAAVKEVAPSATSRLENFLKISDYEEIMTPTDEEIAAQKELVRDEKDIHVALAAMNAQVDYLVSLDKDLTEPGEPIHQYLKILLPGAFLREHMGWSSEQLEAIRKRAWQDLA